ncbi:hypothetical protein PBAL39_23893 [Pedobacter sp. BAL39]|uniref:SusD/RagB family nutrient-binding outer membrane lipoprotein n=1 Tax=Pedobacter sp. BAL39 TaxID=391596 RepID=UPI000155AE67|nr:SusD/RagB family nutrient-binding outer membrane lipoprotein [Pedobacter sp. BAL39]EDM34578.1 hypothetical protein PBAL39_23893 [Pedobacter sp. BAL39]
MKNITIKSFVVLGLITAVFSGCKKSLEDKFLNPELSTTASLPGFLTDMINNDRVRPSYWNLRTFLLMHSSVYSQTAAFSPSPARYQQQDGYTNDYWRDFYSPGVLGMYRAMELTFNALPEAEKPSKQIYMEAAKIILYDQAAQMVDYFGDIPFSEAGSLPATNTITLPKFDDQEALYTSFIDGLAGASTYFATATTNADFNKSDILNSGSVDKWRRYANSVRLRLLMRISTKNEAVARPAVLEMLNNPANYPLVDGSNNRDYAPLTSDILLRPLTTNTSTLADAYRELNQYFAPDYMLNTVMNPSNDPRIPVLFDKFGRTTNNVFIPNATYRAMPITFTDAQVTDQYQDYATIDSATIWMNMNLPGLVVTSSEVNFLKAEALERWGSTAAAKTAYETAVGQSVSFYYYLNSISTLKREEKPLASVIDNFIANSTIAYAGTTANKLRLIGTQKWLHYGTLQSQHAWSEYRRTGIPALTFVPSTLAGNTLPPTRLLYPSVETTNNSQNYQAVQSKDTRTAKIFWMP